MSGFPGSPKLIKGALISYDTFSLLPSAVIFQYNPETLTRQLQTKRSPQGQGAQAETNRLAGAPKETISLKVEIDATDQLEKPEQNATTVSKGIYPQLYALEVMIYPKSSWVIAKTALAASGAIEVAPPGEPFTIFVWGPNRVVPVRISTLSITEQYYDAALNPIMAEVTLSLEVLTYDDFKVGHPGYAVFLTDQIFKETMAAVGSITSASSTVGAGL